MRGIVSLVNLGCPKNRVDGERLLANYAQQGWIVGSPVEADLLIVNTCAFIAPAMEESYAAIEDAVAPLPRNRRRRVVVTGCLVQRERAILAETFPEVSDFRGLEFINQLEIERAPRLVTTFPYAFLKIAEGCSRRCSFCLIPSLRGPYRSLNREWILEEARSLHRIGIQEIVLVAQDATLWGIDLHGREGYLDLVREIADQGFPWVRLLYLHPDRVDADLLKGLRAIPAVIPYLDIPFQHIDSRILALMGREGGEKKIRRLIEEVRSLWPEVALRTSLIAGFPSETEEEFQRLIAFVEETRFDRLALFPYYREEGTVAAELNGQLSVEEKDRRYEELWQLQEKIYQEMSESMVGRTVQVLVDRQDKEDPAVLLCRSTRDAPEIDAYVRVRGSAKPGDFLTVRITKGLVYDVIGEILKEA